MGHKPFNVVADMDSMSMDQLKGAIRNMETIGNAMHSVMRTYINEDTDNLTVMGLDWDRMKDFITELYLPSADGGTVIVNKQHSTSLVDWQLRFFSKYGNLALEVDFETKDGFKVQISVSSSNINTLEHEGYILYVQTKQERERSDAALYESMSKASKKF